MALHLFHYSDVENAFDEPERVARLAGAVESRRRALERDGDDFLVVGTGDVFAPGVLALETGGAHAFDLFDAISPIVETLGNHDFDHGVDRLRELVVEAPQSLLVANAYECEDEDAERFAAGDTAPWTTVEAGEATVGFVGVTHPDVATMAPEAAPVDFRDPIPAAREGVAALRDRGVDHVVVLAHLGQELGERLAATVDADLVLDGHTHQRHADRSGDTAYARTGNGARYVVHAVLDARDSRDASDSRDAGGDRAAVDVELVSTRDEPLHEGLLAAVRDRFAATGLDEVVATVSDPIDCSETATDVGESRVGNLVVDAYRWAADADVAVMSPGGIRTRDDLAGSVTAADLVGLVPFDDHLVTCEVDGETLQAVFESTTMHRHADGVNWKFGHVAGARLVWDDAETAFESVAVDAEPLDRDATYRLAATDYFVETDHIYPNLDADSVVENHGPQYEAILAYAREHGVDPTLEGRIERPSQPASATTRSR